jgi:putative NADPH-quinone reductase
VRALIVSAHPLSESLTGHFGEVARHALEGAGHEVETVDLYDNGFQPCLTAQERRDYYTDAADFDERISMHVEKLRRAEVLVLVFPTWWFGLPAIL